MTRTFVVGVGMTKFERPEVRKWDYPDMGREAGQAPANIIIKFSNL